MSSDDEKRRALARAYRLLSLRARSRKEIRVGLQRAGFSDTTIEETIAQLRQRALLDDREFAAEWTQSRVRSRPRGRRMIERELRAKGIAEEDAAAATSEVDDEATARELALRRARVMRGLDRETFIRRLSNYLLARGFSGETVSRAITAALSQGEDS